MILLFKLKSLEPYKYCRRPMIAQKALEIDDKLT